MAAISKMLRVAVVKGADAALAEDDVGIAAFHDELRGTQQFFEGGSEAALEQDGTTAAANCFKQREVFHVAGADLEDVGILGNHFNVALRHDFGDDGEAGQFASLGQNAEAFFAEALESVGR